MSPCCGSSCMHFKRQKITRVLLAPLEGGPPPTPVLSQNKPTVAKKVSLLGITGMASLLQLLPLTAFFKAT